MVKDYILLANKPAGMTSQDFLNILKKKLNVAKIGHTGTLDPIATGLMVVLINEATKLSDFILALDKTYIATMKLFFKTDTGDSTGNIIEEKIPLEFKYETIIKTFQKFDNLVYEQTVPAYSAVKIKGKKLYEYARNKVAVQLPVKNVWIKKIKLLGYQKDVIKFEVCCSKGTYIRSLINDLATNLKTVATMTDLIRTEQNSFLLKNALTIDQINDKNISKNSLSIFEVLSKFIRPVVIKNELLLTKVKNGQPINFQNLDNEQYVLLVNQNQQVLAIYQHLKNDIFISKRGFNFHGNQNNK